MARMPDGESGKVLTAQGAGIDPAYVAGLRYFSASYATKTINASIAVIETLKLLSMKVIRAFITDVNDITAYIAAYNRLRGVLGVLGGTWYSAPGSLGNATDEDFGIATSFGESRQSADDLAYITWDMGAQYNVILHYKFGMYCPSGASAYSRLKGSVDGTTWTTIDSWSTTSTTEVVYEKAYSNQNYRYFRSTAWYVNPDRMYIRWYEIIAFSQITSQTLSANTLTVLEREKVATLTEIFGFYAIKGAGSATLYYGPAMQVV